MKCKWDKLKSAWWDFWGINDDDDNAIQRLSRSDKRSIWYGSFVMCMAVVFLCMLGMIIGNIRNNRQYKRDVEEALSLIVSYFATATDDEYDAIAQTIRHDLVFRMYGKDMENLIQYIPNTSESCPTCQENYPAQAFLVCVNTGEQYSLDLSQKDEKMDEMSDGIRLSFGYDEISETSIHITAYLGTQNGYAQVYRGRRIISVQKMKSVFCDDCIKEILNTIKGQLLEEIVLFDAEKKTFYPVKDGTTVQIGNYEMAIDCDSEDYRIDIKYVSE